MTPEQLEKRLRRAEKNICCLNNTIEVTLLQAQNLVNIDNLKAGRTYLITDKNLYLPAITTNSFGDGIRVMMCPNFYSVDFTDIYGNYWRGGFYSTNTYTAGDLTIWGGKVWRNLTGNAGNSVDYGTLDSEWELIDPLTFSNHEYTELTFGVRYDIVNDWVEKQWDNRGNEFGISFVTEYNIYGFGYNPCDISDWNLGTDHNFFENKNIGIFNNHFPNGCNISFNAGNRQYISDNIFSSDIDIANNSNKGYITFNIMASSIADNTNNGDISNNSCGEIYYNSNIGGIYSNSNSEYIARNTNTGNISSNSNNGYISYNTNGGDIVDNSNQGFIYKNSCFGGVTSNANSGFIYLNNNNGYISGIGATTTNIFRNINNGDIAVTVVGPITDTVVNK